MSYNSRVRVARLLRVVAWVLTFIAVHLADPFRVFAQETGDTQLPTLGSNLFLWSAVVGFFVPPITDFLKRQSWSSEIKGIVSFAVSVVAGVGTAYFNGDLTGKDTITAVLIVLVSSQFFYRNLFRPTGISNAISKATGGPEVPKSDAEAAISKAVEEGKIRA